MRKYSGYEYILIDIANQYGLDKQLFEVRIGWATEHLNELESLVGEAECQPLYMKAVMALRKAQKGIPSGHLVAMDGVCSGVQIMSALTGCVAGATATGLVDPDVRADAYTFTTKVMNEILHKEGIVLDVSRADAKAALMTSFYGSKAKPVQIFGEDTPELNAFYEAANIVAPGAWELLQDLLAAWKPYALSHEWKLPDGFDAKVKVMTKKEARIEVDCLDHATFTYEFYENVGTKKGISLPANVVHSIDAYVLRSMHRRCNYDSVAIPFAARMIGAELLRREMGGVQDRYASNDAIDYYVTQYERSSMADVVILPCIDQLNVCSLSTEHLEKLSVLVNGMLQYKPFEIVTIHDSFASHANNMNHLRQQYINILAELADSDVLSDVLGQLLGTSITYKKLSNDLGDKIRKSNYALS